MQIKTYSLEEIKNWDTYNKKLNIYPLVSNYMGSILKQWVENSDLPTAVNWLKDLLHGNLNYLERSLSNIITKDEKILLEMLKELPSNKNILSTEISKKIISLNGELIAFSYSLLDYKNIEKINNKGDFICDGIVISVKTKMDLSFNEDIILNFMNGLLCVEEYFFLRNFSCSKISMEGLNDRQRNEIISFLKSDLIDFINDLQEPESEFKSFSVEQKYFNTLWVKGEKYISNNRRKIEIYFSFDGERKYLIKLAERKPIFEKFPYLRVNVYYPEYEKCQIRKVSRSIYTCLHHFDKSSKQSLNNFIGIIVFPISYKHQIAFKDNERFIEELIRHKVYSKDYQVIFYFYPIFSLEMKKVYVYKIN